MNVNIGLSSKGRKSNTFGSLFFISLDGRKTSLHHWRVGKRSKEKDRNAAIMPTKPLDFYGLVD